MNKVWLVYAEGYNYDSDSSPGRIVAICTTLEIAEKLARGTYNIKEIKTDMDVVEYLL